MLSDRKTRMERKYVPRILGGDDFDWKRVLAELRHARNSFVRKRIIFRKTVACAINIVTIVN